MIRWGRALPAEFSERALRDEEVRSLVARVEPRAAGDIDQAWPGRDRARVELRLRDGTVLRGEADCPKGELGLPMSADEVIEKYRELSSYVLSPEHRQPAGRYLSGHRDADRHIATA
jgi:2-methylcitrate dehydratase PrpD